MSRAAGTRHRNRIAARIFPSAVTLCFLLSAEVQTATAEETTGAAVGVGPAAGAVEFTKLMPVANGQYEFRWNPEEYYGAVISRLRQYGFAVHRSPNGLFNQAAPSDARFMLGGSIDEHTCRPIQGGTADAVYCGIAVTWELFDRTRNAVVYKVTARSYVQTSRLQLPPAGHAGNLILGALDSLLSRTRFWAAVKDDGANTETAIIYPFIDGADLTWQERNEKQAQAEAAVRRQSTAERQARQESWERESLPLRNKRRPYKSVGISLTVIGGVSMVTGGIFALTAAVNNSRVEDYREEWMSTVDAAELKRLKQETIDVEERRDLQSALSIGALAFGATSLIVGTVLLAMMPELPPKPVAPTRAKSPLRVRPVIGATELGLRMTF